MNDKMLQLHRLFFLLIVSSTVSTNKIITTNGFIIEHPSKLSPHRIRQQHRQHISQSSSSPLSNHNHHIHRHRTATTTSRLYFSSDDKKNKNSDDEFDFHGFLSKQKAEEKRLQSLSTNNSNKSSSNGGIRQRVKQWWNTRRGSSSSSSSSSTNNGDGSNIVQEIKLNDSTQPPSVQNTPSSSSSNKATPVKKPESLKERLRRERHEKMMAELSLQMAAGTSGRAGQTIRAKWEIMDGMPSLGEIVGDDGGGGGGNGVPSPSETNKLTRLNPSVESGGGEEMTKEEEEGDETPLERFRRLEKEMRCQIDERMSRQEMTTDGDSSPNDDVRRNDDDNNDDNAPEETPSERFLRRQNDMRQRMGMTERPEKDDDDDDDDKSPSTIAPPDDDIDPVQLRLELSQKALDAAGTLSRQRNKRHLDDKIKTIAERLANLSKESSSSTDISSSSSSSSLTPPPSTNDDPLSNDNDDIWNASPSSEDTYSPPRKAATVSEQMYRSIAAKIGNAKDDPQKLNQWDEFLKKEQEMRRKMEEMEEKEEEEVLRDESREEGVVMGPGLETMAEVLGEEEEEEEVSLSDSPVDDVMMTSPQKSDDDVTAQMYRWLSSQKKQSNDNSNKAAADYSQFLQKEMEMRAKMNMTLDDETKEEYAKSYKGNRRSGRELQGLLFEDTRDDNDHDHDLSDWIQQRQGNDDDRVKWRYDDDDDAADTGVMDVPNTPFFQDDDDDDDDDTPSTKSTPPQQNQQIPTRSYNHIPQTSTFTDMFPLSSSSNDDSSYLTKTSIESLSLQSQHSFTTRRDALLHQNSEEITLDETNALFEHEDPLALLLRRSVPNAAFGMIFRFEGSLVDVTGLYKECWRRVLEKRGEGGVRRVEREVVGRGQGWRLMDVVKDGFFWTEDRFELGEWERDFREELELLFSEGNNSWLERIYKEETEDDEEDDMAYDSHYYQYPYNPPLISLIPHTKQWLRHLRDAEIPTLVLSSTLTSHQLTTLLNITNLEPLFTHTLSIPSFLNNNTNTNDNAQLLTDETQQYLRAALTLHRRPDRCCVFDTYPQSANKAHDVGMTAVSLMYSSSSQNSNELHYPLYELKNADVVVAGWDELSVVNVRRLFGDREFEKEPMVEFERERPEGRRRVRRWKEGDRD